MENVTIYEIPPCKMVASKVANFGEGKLEAFDQWFSAFQRPIFPKDFLWYNHKEGGFVWYYIYDESMNVPEEFELHDFPGGLYAVATGIDGQDSSLVMDGIKTFIKEKSNIVEDESRAYLGNIPTPPRAFEALGYNQMNYYIPIKDVK